MATPYKQVGTRVRADRERAKAAKIKAFEAVEAGLEPLSVEPPEWLADVKAKDAWRDLFLLLPHDVVRMADTVLVALACRLLVRLRDGEIGSGEVSSLVKVLGSLGMTPDGRRRLALMQTARQPEAADRFSRFV